MAQSGTFASRNRRHFAHANTLFPTWAVLDRVTRRTATKLGLRSAYGSLMTIQDMNSDFVEPANTELIARRAVRAAYFGFFVDMFEVYLPIAVLAPALEYFIPAGLSAATKATIFAVVFAISLMGRLLARWSLATLAIESAGAG